MNKKNLFLWSLYDFGNSFVFINFLLYFGQWLVIDGGLSDFWYNAIFAITTILLLVTAPAVAAYVDRSGGRKFFLNLSTVGMLVSYALAVSVAFLGTSYVLLAALFFLVGQYFYQFSFVFFNAMIEDVAPLEKRGRASGITQFSNSLGQVLGLLLTLPFLSNRLTAVAVSLAVTFVLVIPTMIYFKESRSRGSGMKLADLREDTRMFFKKLSVFFSISTAIPMLIAFFFFNDAIITLSNNFGILLERVYAIADTQKSLLLMGILVMSALGGGIVAWKGDRIGNLNTLKVILVGWLIALPLVAIAPTFTIFAILSVPVGLLIGSAWAASRAYMSTLLSQDEMTYGFSFYTIAERFAALLGPLVWGGIVLLGNSQPFSYRIAIIAMALFILIGLIILLSYKRR